MSHSRPATAVGVPLDTLPVAVHNAATQPRLCTNEMARFEAVLDAVDAANGAALRGRAPFERPELTAEDAQTKLQAVLCSVRAVCTTSSRWDPASPPGVDASVKELVKWTLDAITDARTGSMNAIAERNLAPGMRPEHVAQATELMQRLNRALGGGGESRC